MRGFLFFRKGNLFYSHLFLENIKSNIIETITIVIIIPVKAKGEFAKGSAIFIP